MPSRDSESLFEIASERTMAARQDASLLWAMAIGIAIAAAIPAAIKRLRTDTDG